MRGKGMVALGRVVLAMRERVIMLQPWDKGLMATTLRCPFHQKEMSTSGPSRQLLNRGAVARYRPARAASISATPLARARP